MADKPEIDKEQLYGKFQAGEERRQKLHERLVHKAYDLAQEEDVNIVTTRNTTGIGTLGAMGIAGVAGVPSAIMLAMYVWSLLHPAAPPTTPAAPPADSAYTVRVYDGQGKEIPLVHLTEPPTPNK